MGILIKLWRDESGFVLSAEAVVIGSMAVIGSTVGLKMLATAVNEEMTETAFAIRSLNQSYSMPGFSCGNTWSAGSEYIQQDVDTSLQALSAKAVAYQAEDARKRSSKVPPGEDWRKKLKDRK